MSLTPLETILSISTIQDPFLEIVLGVLLTRREKGIVTGLQDGMVTSVEKDGKGGPVVTKLVEGRISSQIVHQQGKQIPASPRMYG
jgi:hypothetical protein